MNDFDMHDLTYPSSNSRQTWLYVWATSRPLTPTSSRAHRNDVRHIGQARARGLSVRDLRHVPSSVVCAKRSITRSTGREVQGVTVQMLSATQIAGLVRSPPRSSRIVATSGCATPVPMEGFASGLRGQVDADPLAEDWARGVRDSAAWLWGEYESEHGTTHGAPSSRRRCISSDCTGRFWSEP